MLSCSLRLGEPINLSATRESFFRHNINDATLVNTIFLRLDFVFKVLN